jgi:hypothetical protein
MRRKEVTSEEKDTNRRVRVSARREKLMLMTSVARATSPGRLPARQRMEGRLTHVATPPPRGRCSGPAFLCTCSGQGTLTHVGKVRFHSTHCCYLTTEGTPGGHFGQARMVMVTPGGEEIHATYTGRKLHESRYLAFVRVTGGLGEFSEATGSLVAIVTVDPANSEVSIRAWGWMAR